MIPEGAENQTMDNKADWENLPSQPKDDYDPIGCDHKIKRGKYKGFSSYQLLSHGCASGPDLMEERNVMICMRCGDMKVSGHELINGQIHYYSHSFDVNYPDAVAAIVKACNWFHRDTEGYEPFVRNNKEGMIDENELLEAFNKHGINTTNFDGDEDAATIIALGVKNLLAELNDECDRLTKVSEFWQKKYHEDHPGWQPPKIDNL